MSKGFASSYRLVLLASGLLVCFAALGVRLVRLHVVDREKWLATIVKTRRQLTVEKARRGDIMDAHGAVLATSRSLIVLGVDPGALVEKDERKWPQLAAMIGLPEADLRKIFTTKFRAPAPTTPAPAASAPAERASLVFNFNRPKSGGATPASGAGTDEDDTELDPIADAAGRREIRWAKLRDDISEQLYADIQKLGIKGLTGDRVYRRVYPNNQMAAHLIGYVNREERPAAGIEYYTDFYLRGQNGWSVGERDGRGRELAQFRTRDVPHADGYSVVLSIDSAVQNVIEQELDYLAKKFQPLKATIIVSYPRTGFILGMANYPTFNLNEYSQVPKEEMNRMKNVAVTDVYEPGSVFKIVAASGALEEHLVTAESSFDCSIDKIDYKGHTRGLPREDHHFGRLTVAEIIAHSSNRGAAQLAMELGEDRFYGYARAFGFGHRLGFPIGGEEPGIMAAPEKWDGLTITRMPMGQSVACTVLQMHQAMSTIANGGLLLRPQIIAEIRDASGERVFSYDRPIQIGRAVSAPTARTMATLLMGVVTKDGTAPEAAIPGFDVAGKTGTTQKIIDGHYSEKHHVASFVGFFPANPGPGERQVAISVIVDDADAHALNGVAYGKGVAAPSFKNIGEKLIPILELKSASPAARTTFAAAEGGRR